MGRGDRIGRRRETRFRRARVLLFVVVAICLAQVGWWIYFQAGAAGRESELSLQLGEDPAQVEQRRDARMRMAFAEGGFLALALLTGVVSIYGLMGRELKREFEQNQLLAAVSHDFRTPLTAIRLVAQSFELGRVAEGDRERLAQALLGNARRLEELVENVLAAARLHAGRLEAQLEEVDLGEEVERCLEQRRALLEDRGAEVARELELGVRVRADRSLLQSALGNLLDNALKYSGERPVVAVSVSRRDGRAQIGVTDRGAGFDPRRAGSLFERFQRGDAEADASRPGLGLGLYLVREIVRLHGGEVRARSDGPGTGSTFTLALPAIEGARA